MGSELGSDIWFSIIAGSILFFMLCAFILSFTSIYIRRRKQYREERKQLESYYKQTLLKSKIEIQEQTFQYLAREIHDNIGQIASLIKIHLNTIKSSETKSQQRIVEARQLIRQLIGDLKQLSLNLDGDRVSKLGILESLQNEVDRINRLEQMHATLRHEGGVPALDPHTEVILHRMSQEILNNALKHSSAQHLTINLFIKEEILILEFVDDGKGFELQEAIRKGGAGLINLQERAKLIHGKISIESNPKGTRLSIELPFGRKIL